MASIGVHEQTLALAVAEAARKARARREPVLAGAVVPFPAADPVQLFCRARELAWPSTLWAVPSSGTILLGVGTAWVLEARGAHRFRHIRDMWRRVLAGAVIEGFARDHATGPVALGGFAFEPTGLARGSGPGRHGGGTGIWSDFPDAWLAVPRFLLTRAGGET